MRPYAGGFTPKAHVNWLTEMAPSPFHHFTRPQLHQAMLAKQTQPLKATCWLPASVYQACMDMAKALFPTKSSRCCSQFLSLNTRSSKFCEDCLCHQESTFLDRRWLRRSFLASACHFSAACVSSSLITRGAHETSSAISTS